MRRTVLVWDVSDAPSKSSFACTFSGFRCFVMGMASESCLKFVRVWRYSIERDMIVSNC